MSKGRVLLAGLIALAACQPAPAPAPAVVADSAPTPVPAAAGAAPPEPVPARAPDFTLPGGFAPDTSLAQLRQRFGAANVRVVDDLPMAEGETIRGVLLFADDSSRRATLYFQDAATLRGLARISIADAGSRWRLPGGVRIGMPLAELVQINGAPVSYYGLDWDYGGHVVGWLGGALDAAPGRIGGSGVRLAPSPAAGERDYPQGDTEFRSDDKRWPKAGRTLIVGELGYDFAGEDDL